MGVLVALEFRFGNGKGQPQAKELSPQELK